MRSLIPGGLAALTVTLVVASAAHAQDGYRRGPLPPDARYSDRYAGDDDAREDRDRAFYRPERGHPHCGPTGHVVVQERRVSAWDLRCDERRDRLYRRDAVPVRRYVVREECVVRRPPCARVTEREPREAPEERRVERYERPRDERPREDDRETEREPVPAPRESVSEVYAAPPPAVATAPPVRKPAPKPATITAVKPRVRKPAY